MKYFHTENVISLEDLNLTELLDMRTEVFNKMASCHGKRLNEKLLKELRVINRTISFLREMERRYQGMTDAQTP
jgi:hypothetical protein